MIQRLRSGIFLIILLFPLLLTAQVNVELYMQRGRSFIAQKEFPKAVECFSVVINNKNKAVEAYFLRGITKYYLNDYNGALTDLSQAIKIHPYHAKALQYRAVVYDKTREYSKSLIDYNLAAEMDPFNAELYLNRGVLKSRMGDFKGALEDYDKTISLNPKIELAYLNRALSWQNMDSLQAALEDYNRVIAINSYSEEAYTKRGMLFTRMDNPEDAMKDFNYVLRVNNKNTLALFNRALLHIRNQDTLLGLEDYNRIIELDPRNSTTLFNRAILHSLNGNYDLAQKDYTAVLDLNPRNILSLLYRGTVFLMQENYLGAIEDYSLAIKLYPDFADAYQNRSYAYQQLGRQREAMADRQKLIKLGELKENDQLSDLKEKKDFFKEITDFNTDWYNYEAAAKQKNDPFGPQENFKPVVIPSTYTDLYISLKKQELKGIKTPGFTNQEKIDLSFVVTIDKVNIPSDTILNYINKTKALLSSETQDKEVMLITLGVLQSMINDYNAALEALTEALSYNNKRAFTWFCISSVKYDMLLEMEDIYSGDLIHELGTTQTSEANLIQSQNFQEVVQLLDEAIKNNTSSAVYYYNRANLKNRLQQRLNAIFDYTMALVQEPDLAQAYFNRGLTQIYLGDSPKGIKDLSKSGELGLEEAYPIIKKFQKK